VDRCRALAVLTLTLITPVPLLASVHVNKEVAIVHSPDARECVFFQLSGVNEADPVIPGNPWFAVAKSHTGYKEIFAALLIARTTGRTLVHVATNGTTACGHAAVASVAL
jgi:hypothetical protein